MVHPRHWKNFAGLPHISVVSYFFWEMDIIKMSICSSFIVVLLHITSRIKGRWRIQMPTTIVKPSFYLFPMYRLILKCFHEFTKMRGVSLLIVNFFLLIMAYVPKLRKPLIIWWILWLIEASWIFINKMKTLSDGFYY